MHASWKFPGSPVVETPCFQCRGHGFDPSSGELGSHMLHWHGMAKNKNLSSLFTRPWSGSPWKCQLHRSHHNRYPPTFHFFYICLPFFESAQFSRSVMSDSLRPYGLQRARPPCPLPAPGACSNSCPSSRWCHPTVSSSVVPFFSCLQSFLASGASPSSQFLA